MTPEQMRRRQRMADFDAGRFRNRVVGVPFADFFCENCQAWTMHRQYTDDELEAIGAAEEVTPVCGRCHEAYQCGECGYEIDQEGNCLRPEGHEPTG